MSTRIAYCEWCDSYTCHHVKRQNTIALAEREESYDEFPAFGRRAGESDESFARREAWVDIY